MNDEGAIDSPPSHTQRRARHALVGGAVAVVALVAVVIAITVSRSGTSSGHEAGATAKMSRPGADVSSMVRATPSVPASSVGTTVPPVETDDPVGELNDRLDSGYLVPVAKGTAQGVPWSLYLLDARSADGVAECVAVSTGNPGGARGESCASAHPSVTSCSSSTMIAAAVVAHAGRYVWSQAAPGDPTLLAPGAPVTAGDNAASSRRIQTPYGERDVVVYGYPGSC